MFEEFWSLHSLDFILVFLTGKTTQSDPKLIDYLSHFYNWHKELIQGAHQAISWKNSYDILRLSLKGLSLDLSKEYLKTMRSYKELVRPLLGKYAHLRNANKQQTEKDLANAFYPVYGYGFARSQAYRQSAALGSTFKLITAYEGLIQTYNKLNKPDASLEELNPLEIVDQVFNKNNHLYVGYMDGKPIPRLYQGGRLPRSISKNIGKLDIIKAIERSSNPYFSLLASEVLEKPDDLAQAARLFSFGRPTGIDLPYEISGCIPTDLKNKTSLYAFAIGQGAFSVTPLQTAVMLSTIANGGYVLKPHLVHLKANRKPLDSKNQLSAPLSLPLQEELALVGIDFPLSTTSSSGKPKNLVQYTQPEVKQKIFMPELIRKILLVGMKKVVQKIREDSLGPLMNMYKGIPSRGSRLR